MNIVILCIGTLKESYLKDAASEYLKRLRPYSKITIIEIKEALLPKDASAADESAVQNRESEALLYASEKYGKGAFIFALDPRGKQKSSENFAEKIEEIALSGKSTIVFLIGGSLGLSDAARKKADAVLSFSEMTFPHQLMRVILLEQIYRAQKILRKEAYHK